jgi:hypothetical protein
MFRTNNLSSGGYFSILPCSYGVSQELEGTRRRERPRKGWKEEVERDFQVLGVRKWREFVIERKKIESHFSIGQSPRWAVVPMEEEEEDLWGV